MIALLALGAIGSTLALRQILLDRVDDRIENGLTQEVTEFRRFAAAARDPATGRPIGDRTRRLFDLFLARDVPDEGEATFTFIGDRPYRSNADLGTSEELLAGVRRLGAVETVRRGDLSTPAGEIRYLAIPVESGGNRLGVFVVTASLGQQRSEVTDAVRVAAAIALAMLVIVSALVYVAVGRILAPLRSLGEAAGSIESGQDLTRRIEVDGDDEIAQLARLFNAMLDRLEAAFALQREFVADVGHELRTPITIIRGHLELAGDDPDEREEAIATVTDELDRMSRLVEDLMTLARSERPDFLHAAELDLDLLTEELGNRVRALAPRDWRLERTGVGLFSGDRQRLMQAVTNLAQNAVQSTGEGDRIGIGSELDGGEVRLWVRDDGPGIEPGQAERIFERYGRSGAGAASDGAGLGLAIVRTIAEAHGGRAEVESVPGKGSLFTIVIPQRPTEEEPWEGS